MRLISVIEHRKKDEWDIYEDILQIAKNFNVQCVKLITSDDGSVITGYSFITHSNKGWSELTFNLQGYCVKETILFEL